ncbi:MAG TPA: GNAT family N-acetyltransferase [Aliidongia sp.]|uniref:GNAT family N-acetyltransferase n=1 Tax=Aliidongia sp. TaxID=1914230 RepID=UPI002DDD6CE4|nr:GNAT family N-acetyltransferase [Aliidongia sp.]HEV2678022.1 GNAT family N-acetyltransferase [Aliidongia sp.]
MIQLAEIQGYGPSLFAVAGRRVVRLTEADAAVLQRLLSRCDDYFEMLEGRPAGPTAALEQLRDAPGGCLPDDIVHLGILGRDGELLGLIGALRHHCRPDQWYLGFLLLDPAWRGRGVGSTAYWAFQQWAAAQGAQSIVLAVLKDNERAHRFWRSLGFGDPRSYPVRQIGLKRHILIEYEKNLVG